MNLPVACLEVPPVRITSYMPEDLAAEFQLSVATAGVLEALMVGIELPPAFADTVTEDSLPLQTHPIPGAHYWIVNGKHRAQEALVRGDVTLPCACYVADLRKVILHNLATSGLHGRPKVAELRQVIGYLEEREGLDSIGIRKAIGLSQSYVENLQWVNRAPTEVQEAVDAEILGVGKAVMIARIDDPVIQLRVFYACLDNNMTEAGLREHIKLVEAFRNGELTPPPPPEPQGIPMAVCTYCRADVPTTHATTAVMCPSCAQAAYEAVHQSRTAAARSQ